MKERSEKISVAISGEKNHMKRPEQRVRASKIMIKKWELNEDGLRERMQDAIANTHETKGNPGFKTKRYDVQGYICQGRSEKDHLEFKITNNYELPLTEKKYVNTPFGFYHPDFEYATHYEEIKSIYTFNIFLGEEKNHDQEYQNEQMQKVIWIGKNIKPVHLFVYENKQVINIIIFDKDYDDSSFEFKPSKMIREKLSPEERQQIAINTGIKQRGKIRKEESKKALRNTIKKRKEENPELHKEIYEKRDLNVKVKKDSMTEEELNASKKKFASAQVEKWERMKKNENKMAIRSKKIRDSKNLPPQEIFDKINAFASSYTSIFQKNRLLSVLQFSFSGEFIKEFVSVQIARKETGITTIMDCVKGRQNTAGGFIWK